MITIIDEGMGNPQEISQLLEKMGHDTVVTSDPEQIRSADGIILSGVGAFGELMWALKERGLATVIKEEALTGKPLLGIQVGMQVLFTSSDELGYHQGLNLLSGHVVPITTYTGWEWLQFKHPHPLFRGLEEGEVYVEQSFQALPRNEEDVIATVSDADEGNKRVAVVARHMIMGLQFCPVKSGELGTKILHRFAHLVQEKKEREPAM